MQRLILSIALLLAMAANAEPQPLQQLMPQRATAVVDRTVYSVAYSPAKVYLYISKPQRTLYVCEERCTGRALIAAYPVCLGENKGQKRQKGDRRTPECNGGIPFVISEIADASAWCHDFGDGRGLIPAYGLWFLRLRGDYVGEGIGIHGSTGNRYSVPGRGSEGCIRLRDEDIIHLKENYAFVGMNVYIERDH